MKSTGFDKGKLPSNFLLAFNWRVGYKGGIMKILFLTYPAEIHVLVTDEHARVIDLAIYPR